MSHLRQLLADAIGIRGLKLVSQRSAAREPQLSCAALQSGRLCAADQHPPEFSARPDLIDTHLGDLAAELPGIRVPGTFDGFERIPASPLTITESLELAFGRTYKPHEGAIQRPIVVVDDALRR